MCLAKWERKHLVRRAVLSEWIVLPVMLIGFAPLFGSWWLLCFGVALIACVVGWKSRSAAFLRSTLCDPDSVRTCLPLARGTSDGSLHATVMALYKARGDAVKALVNAPPEVAPFVGPLLPAVVELEHRAAGLVAEADRLDQFLAGEDVERLRREGERVDALAREASSEQSRLDYAAVSRVRTDQIERVEEIRELRGRLAASLDRILALLEQVPSRVMRLRTLDTTARQDPPELLEADVARLETSLGLVEEAFRAAARPAVP